MQVVVGARSAVFAPVPQLGLIVIDEEHETSFKQETTPRYHAREVARRRAELESVPLLLGSATPTLESWHNVATGADSLLTLPRRVAGRPMPPVVVVDVRNDPSRQAGCAIGRALRAAMLASLEGGGQVILFLNLRGYSPVLWCKQCGTPVKCPHCDVSLTWHKERRVVLCHTCSFEREPPRQCPNCNTAGLRYLGVGTQRLEHEVRTRFAKYPCIRMDSDSMKKPGSHDKALEAFRSGAVRILLGTQMISKGLDFPEVTLVGVIDADTMLHQPDLRSSERTFQLIAQVAGRTGRGHLGGRVLVQTAAPGEPAIAFAARHDYAGFSGIELAHRKALLMPPFSYLTRVILRGPDEALVQADAKRFARLLDERAKEAGLSVRILGPAPAPVARLQGKFRYHFQVSAAATATIEALLHQAASGFKASPQVEFVIDVDPINLR
jgi:primosomal protein N' (replication factor Y)